MIQKEILKCNLSQKSRDKVWSGSWFASSSPRGGRGGGALGYFLGGYVPPGTPNWHPVLKKFPLKVISSF